MFKISYQNYYYNMLYKEKYSYYIYKNNIFKKMYTSNFLEIYSL